MIKYFAFGLLGIFAMMVLPIHAYSGSGGPVLYGIATITQFDSDGNEILQQTIHNQLLDQGEEMIIKQVFKEGGTGDIATDSQQIASICISDDGSFTGNLADTLTAAGFDTNDAIGDSDTNCIAVSDVTNSTAGIGVIGSVTFTEGTHMTAPETITGIGICQGSGSTPFSNCNGATGATNDLFAAVDITDITIASSETAQITYTFDIDE